MARLMIKKRSENHRYCLGYDETEKVLLTETFPAETGSMRASNKALKSVRETT